MTFKKRRGCNKKTGRCLLTAAGSLTIDSVAQDHAELVKHFTDYDRFEIDLGSVEEIDFSGVQLLLAMQRSATLDDNKQLSLKSPSQAVADAFDRLHLGPQFDWDDGD